MTSPESAYQSASTSVSDMGGSPRRIVLVVALAIASAMPAARAEANDVDALMERVLDNRYTSWQKLGDFTLRHVLAVDLEAPLEIPFSGLRREYKWYVLDGVAVRSPVRIDGLDIGPDDRRDAEEDWKRGEGRRRAHGDPQNLAPRFVSDAFYGTEFPFEPGAYYFVGRDTVASREVVRIEYYPTGPDPKSSNPRLNQGFNSTSVVTFWVDVKTEQIAKYEFANAGMDFLPLRWLARVEGFEASAEMIPVGDVWMPARATVSGRIMTARGAFQGSITQEFFDYREAETGARLVGPVGAR